MVQGRGPASHAMRVTRTNVPTHFREFPMIMSMRLLYHNSSIRHNGAPNPSQTDTQYVKRGHTFLWSLLELAISLLMSCGEREEVV